MTMTIDLSQALAGLNRLAMLDMSPWLATVGQKQQELVQQRIRTTKLDPDNAPWSPWRPFTEAQRTRKGNAAQGLLWDSGTLLNSIHAQSDRDGVAIGTDVAYASDLQNGLANMAARPFLGWSDSEITSLEFSAVQFIEAML